MAARLAMILHPLPSKGSLLLLGMLAALRVFPTGIVKHVLNCRIPFEDGALCFAAANLQAQPSQNGNTGRTLPVSESDALAVDPQGGASAVLKQLCFRSRRRPWIAAQAQMPIPEGQKKCRRRWRAVSSLQPSHPHPAQRGILLRVLRGNRHRAPLSRVGAPCAPGQAASALAAQQPLSHQQRGQIPWWICCVSSVIATPGLPAAKALAP